MVYQSTNKAQKAENTATKAVNAVEESEPGRDYTDFLRQAQSEIKRAQSFLDNKKASWEARLKVYNNQKRDPEAVGDPLLFTVMQTLLASLYEDELTVVFEGREGGDIEVAESVQAMAMYDAELMEKDQLDYDWDWDTLFFGRGLMLQDYFDRKLKVPISEVVDPMNFLRDDRATSVNGAPLTQKGALRYWGREIWLTMYEMEDDPNFFDLDKIETKEGIGLGNTMVDKAREARANADGNNYTKVQNADMGENAEYSIMEWYTHFRDTDGQVKKVCAYLANDNTLVVGFEILKDQKEWPLIDRPLYPSAHDWDGVSVPDLVEDKQRARSIALNLALKAQQADVYPMYVYDKDKIPSNTNLSFGFNKFIPVNGQPAQVIQPMNKANPNMDLVSFIMGTLDMSSQKATATPDLQQGAVSGQSRTLGELNLVASKVDTRYTLSLKVFGWSEKRFWRRWYRNYLLNFRDDMGDKMIRIRGYGGTSWRPLTRKDIEPKLDLDISIQSKIVSEVRNFKKMEQFKSFVESAIQDPSSDKRAIMKLYAQKNELPKDEINAMFPLTWQEMLAESENDQLNKEEKVPIAASDDHVVHLMIHQKAKTTKVTLAHVETHKKALLLAREAELKGGAPATDPTATSEATPPPNANALPPEGVSLSDGMVAEQTATQPGLPPGVPTPSAQAGAGVPTNPTVPNEAVL